MKNILHPHMFPTATGSAESTAVMTDADVAGIASTPAPATAWANPMAHLNAAAVATADAPKAATRVDKAIEYLRLRGPSTGADLGQALGIVSKGGVSPFISSALKDGRIVRVDGKYAVPDATATQMNTEVRAIAHFEAASAIVAGRKKAKVAAPAPTSTTPPAQEPVDASEAAAAIAAMRKPTDIRPPEGRKPEFVVFVDDVQLLSWPGGDLSIQTEGCTVDLTPHQLRALVVLADLRK